mmetsp:Transcript_3912/g.6928  ORF Transcript_3912/g.6928 Transcript_3912/m.6928 type:complete len:110 (+) Transcript_3912:435-764(+)
MKQSKIPNPICSKWKVTPTLCCLLSRQDLDSDVSARQTPCHQSELDPKNIKYLKLVRKPPATCCVEANQEAPAEINKTSRIDRHACRKLKHPRPENQQASKHALNVADV